MENKKEMTIPNVSAATDAEQSLSKCTDNSIVNQDTDFKGYEQSFEEMQREILRQLDPSYLKTVSMTTLYDTVFEVQTPLIDGLLQRGTYLFVGSPKVGKSFMMAQLAYHISTGTPLWEYKVRKATVLYFALEDDYPRLQKRLFQMFGAKETGNLYFATECKTVNGGLEEQIRGFMREHPDTRIRTYLGSLKYTPDEMEHPIRELSGGQKAKVLLLRMSLSGANVLILDEPTRNFSPLSGPVIRKMLREFPGAVISISHDRKYIEEVCDKIYQLNPNGLQLIGD